MPTVSKIAVEYQSKGAGKVQKDNQRVRKSISKTSRKAKKEESTISDWMDKHKKGLTAIGAATAGIAAAIITQAGDMAWGFSLIRLEFSLLAMTIMQDVNPSLESLADKLGDVRKAYDNLPDPVRNVISHILIFAAVITPLIWIGSKIVGVLSSVVGGFGTLATILGVSATALAGIVTVVGAILVGLYLLETRAGTLGKKINTFLIPAFLGISGVMYILETRVDGFKKAVDDAVKYVWNVWKALFALSGIIAKITFQRIIEELNKLPDKIIDGLGNIVDWFKNLPSNIKDSLEDVLAFTRFWIWGRDMARNLINGIITYIHQKGEDIKDALAKYISFDTIANDRMAQRWGRDMMMNFTQGATEMNLSPITGTAQTTATTNTSVVNISPGAIQIQGGNVDNNRELVEQIADELGRKVASR